jgi:hypothetical protein
MRKRLLIPAALVVGASCTPAQKTCVKDQFHECLPDGGWLCGSEECTVARLPDGGVLSIDDAGTPECFC